MARLLRGRRHPAVCVWCAPCTHFYALFSLPDLKLVEVERRVAAAAASAASASNARVSIVPWTNDGDLLAVAHDGWRRWGGAKEASLSAPHPSLLGQPPAKGWHSFVWSASGRVCVCVWSTHSEREEERESARDSPNSFDLTTKYPAVENEARRRDTEEDRGEGGLLCAAEERRKKKEGKGKGKGEGGRGMVARPSHD